MEMKMDNKSISLNLTVKGIVDIIFRNKMIIYISFLVCMIITVIVILFVTPVFDANVKMLVRGQSVTASETYAPIMASGIHATQAEIVKSVPVLKRAVIALGLQNRPFDYEKNYCSELKKFYINCQVRKINNELTKYPPEKQEEMKLWAAVENLKDRLTVSVIPGTDIFVINVKAFTSEEAIETANVISRSYTMFDQIQQLAEVRIRYGEFHPTVLQLVDNINQATNNLSGETLPDIQAIGTASVKIIEQATSDHRPVSKSKRIILSIALFISICISVGLAFVKGLFDRTLKTPQDIVDNLDIPCIGSIPKKARRDKYLITDDSPDTMYYRFYEELSEQFFVFLKTQQMKSAVITSPSYNKNHKYIIPNIGYFLSRIMCNKVLLIDINFNHPTFNELYSLTGEKYIGVNVNPEMYHELVYKLDNGPDVLTVKASVEKPSTLLNDMNFKRVIEVSKNDYDAIIIDATSFDNFKDLSFISGYADGTVIIIDEGKLQKQSLRNSLHHLKRNDAVIIGGILNNRTFPVPEFVYKNFKYFID